MTTLRRTVLTGLYLMAASIATAYEGPTFSATVWRGEMAFVRIPDKLVGEMEATLQSPKRVTEDGVVIELLGVAGVSYTTRPNGSQIGCRLDIVTGELEGEFDSLAPSYCVVLVDPEAKPGLRDLGPLQLTILDRVLPPPTEWKYFLDLWQHPWAVARYHDVKPFSSAHYQKMKPLWTLLSLCGVKALTTTLLDLPWNHQCYDAYHSMIGRVKKDDGTWVFDYTIFDEYVEFGRGCGIGPDIACYTMCPWGYVVRWQNEKGEIQRATAKPGSPEFDDYWGAFLVDFAAHLKAKGWFEDTYIAMDERSPDDVRFIADYIQKKVPGFKIAMAGNRKPSDFDGITIDNYSQYLSDVTDAYLAELNTRREKGFKTTFYVCCGPARPNTFMTSEDDEAFWLGAYPAMSGFDGFLRWAANSWPRDPYANAAFGTWAPGDTFFIYPNGEMSLRLLNLRAGIVAAEKARILREQGVLKDKMSALGKKYNCQKAGKGEFNFSDCRREIEAAVNR